MKELYAQDIIQKRLDHLLERINEEAYAMYKDPDEHSRVNYKVGIQNLTAEVTKCFKAQEEITTLLTKTHS